MKTLNDYPDYVTAADKLAEVQARHAEAVAERDALLATIAGAHDRAETLADQAQRLLAGDDATVADIGSLRERYARACRQVNLLAEVVRLARHRVEDERATASREICEAARPEFNELVRAELQAAHALLEAQDARRTYWQGLNDSGVSMATLPGVAPLVKGDLRDPTAMFWQRVKDAVELSYIDADTFRHPVRGPDPDSPLNRAGLRLLAAGPSGIGTVETVGNGTTRPVKGQWRDTPKTAPAWGDA